MNFEFDPRRQTGGHRQTRQPDRFPGVEGATGVGQHQIFFRINKLQNVGERILPAGQVGAAQRHRDQPGAAGGEGVAHRFWGREFARAQDEPRTKSPPRNDQVMIARRHRWQCSGGRVVLSSRRSAP